MRRRWGPYPRIGEGKVHGGQNDADEDPQFQVGQHDGQVGAPKQDELYVQDLQRSSHLS